MRKIKKGYEVIVIAGRDKGRRGVVLAVLPNNKLLIEGINTVKKHVKANPNTGDKGGIIIKTHPIDQSNVMLYDHSTGKGSRIKIRIENGKKIRYFATTNEPVEIV